jgi:hypothetical protein
MMQSSLILSVDEERASEAITIVPHDHPSQLAMLNTEVAATSHNLSSPSNPRTASGFG